MGTIEWAAHCLSLMLALSKTFDNPLPATFGRAFLLMIRSRYWSLNG